MRPPSVSCIVVIQYYGAANRNESLLRRPHVAGLLCSENASTGHRDLFHGHKQQFVTIDGHKQQFVIIDAHKQQFVIIDCHTRQFVTIDEPANTNHTT